MAGDLISKLDGLVLDFRIGATAAANDAFGALVGDLITFLESAESGVDPTRIMPILQRGLEAQQRADYIGLADLLQYELGTLIRAAKERASLQVDARHR